MEPDIACVLAPNPGPLTGPGTNTWLVGTTDLCLIDPGPDDDRHLAALLTAIAGRPLRAIVVTHAHRDHCALAPRLARATGAPVLAFGRFTAGSPLIRRLAAEGAFPPLWSQGVDHTFRPDRLIADSAVLIGDSWRLSVLHTPGHLGDHIALDHAGDLFVGDTVLGWSSTVIAPPDGDMGAYLATLSALQSRGPRRLYPGHGAVIADPRSAIADLIVHRRTREAAILAALGHGARTVDAILPRLYPDLSPGLHAAAAMNIIAHLIHLMEQNIVSSYGPFAIDGRFDLS
jgi:glyoxylase-like metal-dependent hydrolase (beta-lactamase superfamily II)